MRRAFRSRLTLALPVTLAIALFAAPPSLTAQVAGRNVNMVSGGTFPGGDPYLQKQNEPSLAMSTRNPCHILAGANDYRAVNLPGLPADRETGDAWVGWYESTDCGATWYSTLVPGYLQDSSAEGMASPVKGLVAAADPVLKPGAAGSFYYLFIAFNRGSNVGKLALARGIDHNDREVFIDPYRTPDPNARRAVDPIQYVDTREIARGSAGQFIDKPSMAVFPAATGTCALHGETVPATNVYVAWTEFIGNSPDSIRTKVYFARSADCGATWYPATKLTEGYPVNQGSVIGVNPRNPLDIYVVWRQVRSDRTRDAILYARSLDGGRSFSKAEFVPGLGEGQYIPFDQNTTSPLVDPDDDTITFRTVGYPTIAFSDEAPGGYLYLALTQPLTPTSNGGLGGLNSRIMLMRTDGTSWSSLVQAVPTAATGQQIMPALAYAAGRLQLLWYDLRFDESGLTNTPLIDEQQALSTQPRIRHTMDVLGAQAMLPLAAWPPPSGAFQIYGVAQPDYNDIGANGLHVPRGPRVSQYAVGDPTPNTVEGAGPRQLQFNFPNLFLYGGGTMPFMGDYIDISGVPFELNSSGQWVPNGLANSSNLALSAFHASWTDNRDAGVPASSTANALGYTPPAALPPNVTLRDTTPCTPDNTRTRDANVYTSRITQDFSLTVPANTKRTNVAGVVRAFAVQLANGTDTLATFTLSMTNANASFSRLTFLGSYPTCGAPSTAPVQSITVKVLPKSSATRTVYVNCGQTATQRIVVTATRSSDQAAASVVINADPSNPATKNANGDPIGPESHNPDAENPDAENPDAENPDAENPDAENPDAENPDAENPDAENPDAENPDAENPDAENPDAENPDAENASYQDVAIDLTNNGDTTSGYQVTVQSTGSTAGYSFLLLANRVYSTPTSINCYLVKRRTNQQLLAIPAPDLSGTFLDANDESEQNATVLVRPGESIRIILRAVWDSAVTTAPFCSTDPNSPDYCFTKLTFRTRAQAPNTGETEPREDSIGGFADLTFTGGMSVAPAVAGLGGIVDSPGATIQNAGFTAATGFTWGAFLVGEPGGANLGDYGRAEGLAPGATLPTGPARFRIPIVGGIEGESPFQPGDYFVGFDVDRANSVPEADEDNNSVQTARAVQVVPYRTTISVPEFVTQGRSFDVTVNVFGSDGASVPNANVTLSLEGPDTVDNVPGPPGTLTPAAPSAVTNSDGQAVFSDLAIGTVGSAYRLIATVDIPGVGTLKFQSITFTVVVYVP